MASAQYTNLRVTNKATLPIDVNLKTVNGESLIQLRESGDITTGVGNGTLYGETVVGVAGVDITMVDTGTAFTLAWKNTIMTEGWTQLGQVITLIDGSVLGGGETIRITYTKP